MLVLLVVLLWAGAVAAQDPTPPPLPGERAPVVLDGRFLFEVGEAGLWSPEQRAAEIRSTLRAAAVASDPMPLSLAEHDGYPIVRMGDWHLVTVADSDIRPGMDPGEQAQRWLMTLDTALQQARLERSPAYRWAAGGRVLLVVVLAVLLHWLLRRGGRRLQRARHGPAAPLSGKPVWQTGLELASLALQVALWTAVLWYAVDQFPGWRQLRWYVARVVRRSLAAPLLTLNERGYSAFDLLWLIAALVVLWALVALVTSLLSWRLARATGATRGALQPMTTLLRYGLLLVGMIVVLQLAGLNLSSLALLASVLGVGIGFGLQNLANNFVSGIVAAIERPVKPGDFVSIGALQGTVERIGGRSTIIRTLDRVDIVVPNSKLLETEVVNWSHDDPISRLHVPVGVAYGSDIEAVRGALLEAARVHPAVLPEPRSEVRFNGFGDSALDFALLVWTADPAGQELLRSDLNYQIERNLRRAAIEVPFPQRTLHLAPASLDALAARLGGESPPAPPAPLIPPADDAPAFPAAPWRALDLDALVARMRGPDGVAIADRRHLLTQYTRCFVGSDAVEWLMRAQDLSRAEAVRLGQTLIERGILHHVLDEHPFRDGAFFYRFYADE